MLASQIWTCHKSLCLSVFRMDESSFALVYGTEVVLPKEASLPTITTLIAEDVKENRKQLERNLDLLEEVQECAQLEEQLTNIKPKNYTIRRQRLGDSLKENV